MKKLFILQLLLLLVATPLIFTSCDDDNEEPKELLPKLDGFYIYGTNTVAASAVEPAARMALAILDHEKAPNVEDQPGVYGKFLFIGANSKIKFAEVKSEVGTVYGAQNGGTVSNGLDVGNVPIDDNVIHGTLTENGPEIEVAEAGLYYAFANVNTGFFVLVRVEANLIGDATPGMWDNSTAIPQKSSSLDSTVFEIKNLVLKGESGYRYRINKGWHAYQEPEVLVTLSSIGVPDYQVAWDTRVNDIGFYLPNIPNHDTGYFTLKLKYIAATNEWVETKVKTGNVLIDYSNHNMAIIGDATENGSFNGNGTGGFGAHKPVKAGNVYTWTWNDVPMLDEKEFIFLQDATWGGLQIDYLGAAISGTAITGTKIIDATTAPVNGPHHNFHVLEAGTYDVTVEINAETNARTITISTN